MVFYLGQGFLEVSEQADGPAGGLVMICIRVRDVRAEHARLAAAGVPVIREPVTEPWGLTEMWIQDPDGVRIVLVEVQGGSTVLVNPQEPALKMLNHTRVTEMFSIQDRTPAETAPDTSTATDRADEIGTRASD